MKPSFYTEIQRRASHRDFWKGLDSDDTFAKERVGEWRRSPETWAPSQRGIKPHLVEILKVTEGNGGQNMLSLGNVTKKPGHRE